MEVKYVSPGELIPYAKNAKQHPPEQVERIANSIKRFGWQQPIVVDRDNVVIIGHGRLFAAKELMLDSVPVVYADNLTEDEVNALRLADNKTNESAWDFSALEEELAALDIAGIDMTQFGFDDLSAIGGATSEITEDEPPEVPEEPKAKRGEIYRLGEHRLMCGDSTSKEDVAALMDGERADMVFTDPPYGYEYQSNMRTKTEKFDVIENDDKILDFFPLLKTAVSGFVMVCTTWKVLDKWLPLFKRYYDLTNVIIWNKGGGGMGDLQHTFSTDYEIILCSNNGVEIKGKRIGSVWDCGKDNANDYIHPTQKPVSLSAQAILHTTENNGCVLDLFGGSGSTLIACEQSGRKCYMMELDPHYIDVIIQRWENLTGQKAELIQGDG